MEEGFKTQKALKITMKCCRCQRHVPVVDDDRLCPLCASREEEC